MSDPTLPEPGEDNDLDDDGVPDEYVSDPITGDAGEHDDDG